MINRLKKHKERIDESGFWIALLILGFFIFALAALTIRLGGFVLMDLTYLLGLHESVHHVKNPLVSALIFSGLAALIGLFVSGSYRAAKTLHKGIKNTKKILTSLPYTDHTVVIIETAEPTAFCVGFFKPKLVISKNLLAELDDVSKAAVVKHERYHLEHRHQLKNLLLDVVQSFLYWLPGFSSLIEIVKVNFELSADACATNGYNSTEGLTRAILSMTGSSDQAEVSALAGLTSAINERIEHIIEGRDERKPLIRSTAGKLVFSMAIIMTFMLSVPNPTWACEHPVRCLTESVEMNALSAINVTEPSSLNSASCEQELIHTP
ncbi:MAG: M56 family metallopeptidase [Candidatus Uhrbacteria bacterium]|nr:M48 family metalloprotease [Patescibacteria group bacterium]MBU1907021.1 M48 family metalloprotease [Patescibacteria group bacterium]